MAGFTSDLPEPGREYAPYGGGGGSGLGGAAAALGQGASDIFKLYQQNQARNVISNVETKENTLVQQYAAPQEAPTQPLLLGEVKDPGPLGLTASVSPVVQNSLNEFARLDQINRQGGFHGGQAEFFTRTSMVVQDAINQNPLYANEIRQAAQNVLGVNTTAEQVILARASSETAVAVEKQTTQDLAKSAADAGIVIRKPDGTLDIDAMKDAGATVNYQNTALEKQIKNLQLQAASTKTPMSHEEQVASESQTFITGMNPIFDKGSMGLLSQVPAMMDRLEKLPNNEQQVAAVGQAIGTQQAAFNTALDQAIVRNNISPEAAAKAKTYYNSFYDDYKNLFSGPLSEVEARTNALKTMQTNGQIGFRDAVPALARVKDAGGEQAVASAMQVATDKNSTFQDNSNTQITDYLNAPAHPVDSIHAAASAIDPNSKYNIANEQNPTKQAQVLKVVAGTLTGYMATPDKLDPKQQAAFGKGVIQVSHLGLQSTDQTNVQNAAKLINAPAAIRTFQNFAKNDANANQAPIVAQGMLNLNQHNIQLTVGTLKAGEDFSVSNLQGGNTDAHASAVFNPVTGRVELSVQGNRYGKTTALTPDQMVRLQPQLQAVRDNIDSVNKSLDAAAVLKDYTGGREKDLKAAEVKQFIADTSGLGTKNGTQATPMPDWFKNGGPSPNDIIDKLASTPAPIPSTPLAAAVQKVESNNNPNAVSSAGAQGLMQLMPETAKNPGFGIEPAKDDSPEENQRVGRQYLDALTQKYGEIKGVAAYNMGTGAFDKWEREGASFNALPKETQLYIGRVMMEKAKQGG